MAIPATNFPAEFSCHGPDLDAEVASLDPAILELLRSNTFRHIIRDRLDHRKFELFRAHPRQLEFIASGATNTERCLLASNRTGKSEVCAFEVAAHLLGRYPDWWTGRRYDRPVTVWAAGVSGEATRDIAQSKLFGNFAQESALGTGFLPKDSFGSMSRSPQPTGSLDTVSIKHSSGGWSTLSFKAFSNGREKWQGTAVDLIWLDEEAPTDIYDEAVMRLAGIPDAMILLSFTPLKGYTPLVKTFLDPDKKVPGRVVVRATLDDALHIPPEEREKMIARMSPHERDARSRGIPSQGSGVVFPISEDAYKIEPFPIPRHWPQLAAIDLGGYDHPFAGARIAIDRDADCIYVTHVYCVKGQPLHAHAAALRSWGKGLPFAWPHDAMQHDRTSGQRFSDLLREHGLEMLPERVTFPDGGNGLEAGVAEMLDRKMTGRLKVFSTCEQYFKEARDFHRRDGRINPIDDDCIAAVRYSVMGERFAIPPTEFGGASNWSQPLLRGIRRLA